MRLCILSVYIVLSVKLSFGEILRIGETTRWQTLEPVTARLPVEKRISSLLYQRMFLYDKTVFEVEHIGLKPNLVEVIKADTIGGRYQLVFKNNSQLGPKDLLYTIKIMNHNKTIYHQPMFCPYWDLSKKFFYYSESQPNTAGIEMNNGVSLIRANFHLVKNNMFGEYVKKNLDRNVWIDNDKTKEIINNASTGPYKIELIEKNYLLLKSQNISGNIDKIQIDIHDERTLMDRLKKHRRDEFSIDIIPELSIKEAAQFEDPGFEGRYKTSTPTSNNFWVIGFNYHATHVEDVRNLFHKKIFRQYIGLAIYPKKLFEYSLRMNDEYGSLLCGPLYRRPGLEEIDNYIEFCAATRFIRGVESQNIGRYMSFLKKHIQVIKHVNSNTDGALLYHLRPVKFLLLYPMFGIMAAEIQNIAMTIKDRLREKGIWLITSGERSRYNWEKRIKYKDFDLILYKGFYDYSYDITDYFEKDNPLNLCGLPIDNNKKIHELIKSYHSTDQNEDKSQILMKLNALLSNETIGIFLWSLKYKTVYRSVLKFGPGQTGINDIDFFQGIDNWNISE